MVSEKQGDRVAIPAQQEEYGVISCDSDDTIVSWDTQAEKLFGWQHGEAIGQNLFHLIHPPGREREQGPRLRSLLDTQSRKASVTLQIHETVAHRSGHIFPAEFIISPVIGGAYFTIFVRNHEVLRQNTRALLNRAFQFEVISDILKMSLGPALLQERLEEILSYTISLAELELLPMAALFLVEQDAQTLKLNIHYNLSDDHVTACREIAFGDCYCGKAASTNRLQHIGNVPVKHCHLNKAGHAHGHYCVPFSTEGRVSGVLCLFIEEGRGRDPQTEELLLAIADIIGKIIETHKMDLQLTDIVNDLRASIVALRDEKEFSNSVIEGLEQGLITIDPGGVIQKCNGVAKNILSAISDDCHGGNLAALIGRKNYQQLLFVDTEPRRSREREITLTTRNQEALVLRCSVLERGDNGEDLGSIILLADISEWHYVQREMEKMNRLSTVAEIASAVAHEVRNPLAGIKIMAQSIEEGAGSEEERLECSQRIIRQVDRLNELLTDFFSYARPVSPKKQNSSLKSILAETKPLITNKLEKQRITLAENFEKDLPEVNADPNQIQQVFLNLFLNAIDAIRQEGLITITARSLGRQKMAEYRKLNHLLEKDARYIMVTFQDNGSGMGKDAVDKVFEPFYTTKTNGSGLGMSIVYRTLKENDATISVESTEGKGTTFTIFLKRS
jgi:PAS domain S-box-containing protein